VGVARQCHGDGEELVVQRPGVHGEERHEQDAVAAAKGHAAHVIQLGLRRGRASGGGVGGCVCVRVHVCDCVFMCVIVCDCVCVSVLNTSPSAFCCTTINRANLRPNKHTYIHACMGAHVHTHTRTYMHANTHTNTCTHMPARTRTLPSAFSFTTRNRANMSMSAPWPRSPNMTAKRKGKVMMVKMAGLTCVFGRGGSRWTA